MRAGRRAAIAHDWMVIEGGAERVAIEFAELLPFADVYTSFFDTQRFAGRIAPERVRTWPLQRLLGPTKRFRAMLPLYPFWFGHLDLRTYDLVVSSSIAFTHAVRTAPGALHVSYVYTPLRYAWDLDSYLGASSFGLTSKLGARLLRPWLQRWDRRTAGRPDVVIAISKTVQDRIKRLWNRDSEIIYPPVDVDEIQLSPRDDGYLLIAARLLAYRRIDHAVEACTRLGRNLVVVGDGPERTRLQRMAGPSVSFMGSVDRPTLVGLIRRCRAYLVPGVEDFGIAPVEAMAAGKPVVAFRGGGVAETVLDGVTGILYDAQSPAGLMDALRDFDTRQFDPVVIRERATAFGRDVFISSWQQLLVRHGIELGRDLSVDKSSETIV